MSTAAALLLVAGLAVLVPIAEEVAFRGYLFPALTRWSGPWRAALIAALLFGAAHVLAYPPEVLPPLTFFGFGACLLYWMTGSLLAVHRAAALDNGVVIAATTDVPPGVVAAAILAPAIALALCWPFARERWVGGNEPAVQTTPTAALAYDGQRGNVTLAAPSSGECDECRDIHGLRHSR